MRLRGKQLDAINAALKSGTAEDFNAALQKTCAQAEGIGQFVAAPGSEATDKRLMAAVTGLMEIVEGVRNARWSHEGKRLVDTPEWCELYCAWNAAKDKPLNTEVSHHAGNGHDKQ